MISQASVLLLLVTLQVTSGTLQSPSPHEKIVMDAARSFVQQLANGEFDKANEAFGPPLMFTMGAGKLKAQWQMVTEQMGPFKSIVDLQLESQDGFTGVVLNCAFERKNVKVIPWFDDQSRIVRLFYDPR